MSIVMVAWEGAGAADDEVAGCVVVERDGVGVCEVLRVTGCELECVIGCVAAGELERAATGLRAGELVTGIGMVIDIEDEAPVPDGVGVLTAAGPASACPRSALLHATTVRDAAASIATGTRRLMPPTTWHRRYRFTDPSTASIAGRAARAT